MSTLDYYVPKALQKQTGEKGTERKPRTGVRSVSLSPVSSCNVVVVIAQQLCFESNICVLQPKISDPDLTLTREVKTAAPSGRGPCLPFQDENIA